MAGTCPPVKHHVTFPRAGAPFLIRYSTRSSFGNLPSLPPAAEGPSCIFVGPIESASKETLEALYRQARNSYYNGRPLIVDDMFDRVEMRLRWYGSKYVVKYPRCSLRRQSTYSDAQVGQEDPSQMFALASVWLLILGFGGVVLLVPLIYTLSHAYNDAFPSGNSPTSHESMLRFLTILNGLLYILFGCSVGFPIASASVGALRGILKNDLVGLKGACPNCGEEVFAFVQSDQTKLTRHRAECHVCESFIEFRTRSEKSTSREDKRWVHGRVYLIRARRRLKTWS